LDDVSKQVDRHRHVRVQHPGVETSLFLRGEGVDLPAIDTVMMLRPTESKVLFLQQLGRGLRRHPDKERLIVLDFIGNHRGFLNKPQALFGIGAADSVLADFGRRARAGNLTLPPGCYVNYDLEIIDFLTTLDGQGPAHDYQALRDSLGRRPTLAEFYRSGSSIATMRSRHGHWWALVRDQDDLNLAEAACLERHEGFLREVETTAMTKCFKAVLLDSLLENDGFRKPPRLGELASQALEVFRRRRMFVADIREDLRDLDRIDERRWLTLLDRKPHRRLAGQKQGQRGPALVRTSRRPFSINFHSHRGRERRFPGNGSGTCRLSPGRL
ncbi:MAG: hypothetical protein ABFS30_14825, partial [Pseudomonadota bacterium]